MAHTLTQRGLRCILGQCVWLSTATALQDMRRPLIDSNGFRATRVREKRTIAFKRCAVKTSEKANSINSTGLPRPDPLPLYEYIVLCMGIVPIVSSVLMVCILVIFTLCPTHKALKFQSSPLYSFTMLSSRVRLISLAAQKFISEVAMDAVQHSKRRGANQGSRKGGKVRLCLLCSSGLILYPGSTVSLCIKILYKKSLIVLFLTLQ